jgi:hypothetical protein
MHWVLCLLISHAGAAPAVLTAVLAVCPCIFPILQEAAAAW